MKDAMSEKNARIGDNVTPSPDGKVDKEEGDGYIVRDGVIVILKGAVIPNGAII